MAQILDYSAGYPGATHIKRLGYVGGIRYLRKEGTSRVRPLTTAEVLDYSTHGLQLALVYQHVDKARPTQGRLAGRHDAEWAAARAREVGIEPRAIYFAVDFDAVPSTVAEYFRGAAAVLGVERVGGYGGYKVISYLFDQGLIRWGWQTVAWSGGRRETRAHLFQKLGQITCNGIECDVNDVLKPDYGQHPNPTPHQEDDMDWNDILKSPTGYPASAADWLVMANVKAENAWSTAQRIEAKVDALAGALSDDEANIVAAIRQIPAGGDLDEQALAVALGPVLAPLIKAGATVEQVEAAVRRVAGQIKVVVQQDGSETA